MTPEAQRIAIAEACGWRWAENPVTHIGGYWERGTQGVEGYERGDWGGQECAVGLPNYLSDLNAMHEAEKVLTPEQYAGIPNQSGRYIDWLMRLCAQRSHCATAAQRAEAFLKTIGKWTEKAQESLGKSESPSSEQRASSSTLLPCPFCGTRDLELSETLLKGVIYVFCRSCGVGPLHYGDWNTCVQGSEVLTPQANVAAPQPKSESGAAPSQEEWTVDHLLHRALADIANEHNQSLAASQQRIRELEEALRKYARRYAESGKCWNWINSVCDSYSGEVSHFDWKGDEQDEPWEIAERALNSERTSAT